MNLHNAWTIMMKDFHVFRKKTYVLYSLIAFPVIVSILFPMVTRLLISRRGFGPAATEVFINAFSFFYVVGAVAIPITLASYSIVGEKVEKSLEPLLLTPAMDSELLFGKTLAAFLPALSSVYLGTVVFMVLIDVVTSSQFGFFYYPNWNIAPILFPTIPVVCLFGTETNIIISSRVNDIRAAQQLGAVNLIPFAAIYVMFEINFVTFDITTLLMISAVVLVADAALFYINRAIFNREEMLTKWK